MDGWIYVASRLTPLSIFILVNPVSGQKRGKKVLEECLLPLFKIANVHVHVELTSGPHHAYHVATQLCIEKYTGTLLVGGDGLVHEFWNGLVTRYEGRRLDFPVGHVASGTGNGLATSLNMVSPCWTVLAVIHGRHQGLDLMKVTDRLTSQVIGYCHLSVTVGYIADVDIESERYRTLGPLRLDLYAFLRFLKKKYYDVHVLCHGEEKAQEWTSLHLKDSFFINVVNLSHLSSSFQICPTALGDDGWMECIYASKLSFFKGLGALLQPASGKILNVPGVHQFKTRRIELTKHEKSGHLVLDGEEVSFHSVSIELLPSHVRVYCF
ncbi:hypothetical protein HMI54_002016 [Coelomomyces lativittatus]|nr:hypothetical protein HMI54_002016 [Coelomomyces lativittatus]